VSADALGGIRLSGPTIHCLTNTGDCSNPLVVHPLAVSGSGIDELNEQTGV
jgi:hypothetical protein